MNYAKHSNQRLAYLLLKLKEKLNFIQHAQHV